MSSGAEIVKLKKSFRSRSTKVMAEEVKDSSALKEGVNLKQLKGS